MNVRLRIWQQNLFCRGAGIDVKKNGGKTAFLAFGCFLYPANHFDFRDFLLRQLAADAAKPVGGAFVMRKNDQTMLLHGVFHHLVFHWNKFGIS